MSDFFAEVSPKLTDSCLGLVVLGPNSLQKDSKAYFHINFLLDGLLAKKGEELHHKDTFLTRQFNQSIFILYFDSSKMDELENGLKNTLSMLKGEFQNRKKVVFAYLDEKENPGAQKFEKLSNNLGLELVI